MSLFGSHISLLPLAFFCHQLWQPDRFIKKSERSFLNSPTLVQLDNFHSFLGCGVVVPLRLPHKSEARSVYMVSRMMDDH